VRDKSAIGMFLAINSVTAHCASIFQAGHFRGFLQPSKHCYAPTLKVPLKF